MTLDTRQASAQKRGVQKYAPVPPLYGILSVQQGRRNFDNWRGGLIFIYSCSAQLIFF